MTESLGEHNRPMSPAELSDLRTSLSARRRPTPKTFSEPTAVEEFAEEPVQQPLAPTLEPVPDLSHWPLHVARSICSAKIMEVLGDDRDQLNRLSAAVASGEFAEVRAMDAFRETVREHGRRLKAQLTAVGVEWNPKPDATPEENAEKRRGYQAALDAIDLHNGWPAWGKLDAALEEALDNDPGDLFPDGPASTDPMGDALERQRIANARLLHKDDDLNSQAPSDWDMDGQGVVEAMPAVSNVPPEIAALLDDGETLTRDVRRKLTERLNVELAELKNLRGLAGEDLKREAEIEKLLGLFARLGEI